MSDEIAQRLATDYLYRGKSCAELSREFHLSSGRVRKVLLELGVPLRSGFQGWKTARWYDSDGRDFVFRSTWELEFAKYLDRQDVSWDYEPHTFPLPYCVRYTPDFLVDGTYIEIHAWEDKFLEGKIREFLVQYPGISFDLLGPSDLADLGVIEAVCGRSSGSAGVAAMKARLKIGDSRLYGLAV